MSYRLTTIGNKWYVQSESGRYFGGYASQALAKNLMKKLETA